jgi:hypothetical protein
MRASPPGRGPLRGPRRAAFRGGGPLPGRVPAARPRAATAGMPAAVPLFLCRLTPPRPSFPADMSDEERAMMGEHVAHWRGLLDEGRVVTLGPVADPAGAWA